MDQIGTGKAVAAGASGAASVVLMWLLGLFSIVIPPEVASAVTTLAATGAAYLVPHTIGAQQ